MGTRTQAASTRKIVVKVDGRETSVRKPLTIPPTPIPRLTRAKLMPKYWVRRRPSTMLEIIALNAGQPTPKLIPSSTNATTNWGTVVANARTTAPRTCATLPPMTTTRAPMRSVSAPTGPVTREGDDGDEAHEQAGDVERDPPDLVDVDDRERQGHAAPQRGDRRRRQQPPPRGGQRAPETAQRQPVLVGGPRRGPWGVLGGLGHCSTVPRTPDTGDGFSAPRVPRPACGWSPGPPGGRGGGNPGAQGPREPLALNGAPGRACTP